MNNFKDLLSRRRKELKMTQKELAEKLNISDKTISKWETGSSYPEVTMLSTIVRVLDLNINEIFGVEDMKGNQVNLEEQESYNQNIINKFINKIFISIGLIVAGIILVVTSLAIENESIMTIMISIGFAIHAFSFIYFISNCISYRSFYNKKFYTKNYDIKYYKYTSLVIVILVLPFTLSAFYSNVNLFNIIDLINSLIYSMNINVIVSIFFLIFIISSYVAIYKVLKISNFKLKKDKFNIIILFIDIILFIGIFTNLLNYYFSLIVYLLIYIIIFRNEYVDNTSVNTK